MGFGLREYKSNSPAFNGAYPISAVCGVILGKGFAHLAKHYRFFNNRLYYSYTWPAFTIIFTYYSIGPVKHWMAAYDNVKTSFQVREVNLTNYHKIFDERSHDKYI